MTFRITSAGVVVNDQGWELFLGKHDAQELYELLTEAGYECETQPD